MTANPQRLALAGHVSSPPCAAGKDLLVVFSDREEDETPKG